MISYKCLVFYLRYSNSMAQTSSYTEENIKSLDWKEHIRMRPGMYIGKLGDGSAYDDGIYILLKDCLLYTSPSPRDRQKSRMPSSA